MYQVSLKQLSHTKLILEGLMLTNLYKYVVYSRECILVLSRIVLFLNFVGEFTDVADISLKKKSIEHQLFL